MSMVDGAEAVVDRIVPQRRLVSLVAQILPYLLIAALAGFLIWWIFIRPAQLAQEGAQAKMDSAIAAGGAKAATDALKVTVDVGRQHDAIDAITGSNQHAILSAVGAEAPVDMAVYSALHDALCLRAAYQPEPDCSAVRATGESLGPARPDAGGGSTDATGRR